MLMYEQALLPFREEFNCFDVLFLSKREILAVAEFQRPAHSTGQFFIPQHRTSCTHQLQSGADHMPHHCSTWTNLHTEWTTQH